jgi:hypothetical protein
MGKSDIARTHDPRDDLGGAPPFRQPHARRNFCYDAGVVRSVRALRVEAARVSDFDPADLAFNGRRAREPYDEPVELIPTESPERPEREGLPPGYRMRADAHYVEQLTSRRTDSAHAEPPGVPVTPVNPEEVAARHERELRRDGVLAVLAEQVATISSAADLVAVGASPLARRLNIDLIRAEAWQASWLLGAQAVLDGIRPHSVRSWRLGAALERLRQGFGPACRLRGFDLQLRTADWDALVAVDERALLTGLSGAIAATFGLLEGVESANVKLTAEAVAGQLRTVEVAQDEVAVSTHASLRFFDLAWTDRPGGWLAAFGAATARAVAQQHGGNAVLLVGERRGTVVRMTFARGY